jgi:D-3-phosphoglycerate dehydrogenase / 2-oxoglutarate reductase
VSPIKVLHLDDNHPHLISALAAAGFQNHENYSASRPEIEKIIEEYDGIVLRSRFVIDSAFLEKATRLKFIARVGAGLENIDCSYAAKKGIALIAAPEGNCNAVGEHSLAMLLALFNKLNAADREIRSGHWNREQNRGHELDGKTVGIIGYGNMGKAFAKKLRGFDATVLCYDIAPGVADQNAKQVTLEEFCKMVDVVSLHIPFSLQNNQMFNRDFIDKIEKPFWFINTSRGKLVVTSDLVDALKNGKILGAGLDVLEYEKSSFENLFDDKELPADFSFLLQADNVLLTPHVAGWTFESHQRLAQVVAQKIIQLFDPTIAAADIPAKVTGIGGFFFKSENPKALVTWYRDHLGLKTDDYGCSFWWKDAAGNDAMTQWSPFAADTTYFSPSDKPYMQNFRVDNLRGLLDDLRKSGVHIVGEVQEYDYGKFGWIMDPEGNKIELWEPVDQAFQ